MEALLQSYLPIVVFIGVALGLGLALLVLWKHRGNLERLMDGTEPQVGRP